MTPDDTDESQPLPPAGEETENEVLRAVRENQQHKHAAEEAEADRQDRSGWRGVGWKAAAGIGIGSAAVLAALLYANRDRIR